MALLLLLSVSIYLSIYYYKTSDFFVFPVVNVSHLHVQLTSADSLISAQVFYLFLWSNIKKEAETKASKCTNTLKPLFFVLTAADQKTDRRSRRSVSQGELSL